MILIMAVIVMTFSLRTEWWCFADIFFAFMMVFCHLIALYLMKFNSYASRKLDTMAMVFATLAVVSLIVEYILLL